MDVGEAAHLLADRGRQSARAERVDLEQVVPGVADVQLRLVPGELVEVVAERRAVERGELAGGAQHPSSSTAGTVTAT